jgi:hypothetical protein
MNPCPHSSNPVKICEVNGLSENCNQIYVGQILAIPAFRSCTPKRYRWACHTVLDHTDYYGAWGYGSWANVQNGAGQDAFNEANRSFFFVGVFIFVLSLSVVVPVFLSFSDLFVLTPNLKPPNRKPQLQPSEPLIPRLTLIPNLKPNLIPTLIMNPEPEP